MNILLIGICSFIIGIFVGRYIISHGLIRENESLKQQLDSYLNLVNNLENKFDQIANNSLLKNAHQFAQTIESSITHKHEQFNQTISPISNQIKEIDSKIAQFNTQTTTKFENQIGLLIKETQSIMQKTEQLNLTLKGDNKNTGSWGEWTLDNLFNTLGMVEGVDYQKQIKLKDQSGIPDFILNIGNKKLIIDVKSPTNSYLDNEGTKFLDNLKININNLAKKDYTRDIEYFDYLIIYLPLDGILLKTLSLDPELIKYAINKKIILTTPTTIYPIIATLRYIIHNYDVVKNVEVAINLIKDIYGQIQETGDKLRLSIDRLEESRDAYNKIVPTFDKLTELGFIKNNKSINVIKNTN